MNDTCGVCGRDPKRMNSEIAECSHVDCPNRKRLTAFGVGDDDLQLSAIFVGDGVCDGEPKPLNEVFK